MKTLSVLQAVTLGYGTGILNGFWTAGMRVHRMAPLGSGVPVMQHNGTGFYIPIRYD